MRNVTSVAGIAGLLLGCSFSGSAVESFGEETAERIKSLNEDRFRYERLYRELVGETRRIISNLDMCVHYIDTVSLPEGLADFLKIDPRTNLSSVQEAAFIKILNTSCSKTLLTDLVRSMCERFTEQYERTNRELKGKFRAEKKELNQILQSFREKNESLSLLFEEGQKTQERLTHELNNTMDSLSSLKKKNQTLAEAVRQKDKEANLAASKFKKNALLMRKQHDELQAQLNATQEKAAQMANELLVHKQQAEEASRLNETLVQEKQQLEKRVAQLNATNVQNEQSLMDSRMEMNEKQQKLDELQQIVEGVSLIFEKEESVLGFSFCDGSPVSSEKSKPGTARNLPEVIQGLVEQNKNLEDNIRAKEEALAQVREEGRKAQNQKQNQILSLRTQVTHLTQELTQAQQVVTQKEQAGTLLKEQLAAQEEAVKKLKLEVQETEKEYQEKDAAREKEILERDQIIKTQRDQIAQQKQEMDDKVKYFEEYKKKVEKLKQMALGVKGERDTFQAQNQQAQTEIERLHEQVGTLQQQAQERLKSEMKEHEKALAELKQQFDQKLKEAQAAHQEEEKSIRAAFVARVAEVEALKTKLATEEQTHKEQIEGLEEEVLLCKVDAIEQVRTELKSLRAKQQRLLRRECIEENRRMWLEFDRWVNALCKEKNALGKALQRKAAQSSEKSQPSIENVKGSPSRKASSPQKSPRRRPVKRRSPVRRRQLPFSLISHEAEKWWREENKWRLPLRPRNPLEVEAEKLRKENEELKAAARKYECSIPQVEGIFGDVTSLLRMKTGTQAEANVRNWHQETKSFLAARNKKS